MTAAVQAFIGGVWMVVRAPLLTLVVTLATLATALPFGIVLGERLRTSLGNQPPINLDSEEIDPEWWMEFRAQARGLEATFTPAVIGFAAPLDNLSALADGSPRPLILLAPVVLYGLVWAFLLGGLVERFDRNRPMGARAFVRAGLAHLPRFAAIAGAAALTSVLLYLTVHAVLFGPVYAWLAADADSERNAFFWRVALYLVFGSMLAMVSLVADYARVESVIGRAASAGDALKSGAAFVRRHLSSVVTLYVTTGFLFVALLILYGLVDRRFGGWRGVLLGQAYIVARIGIRLTFAASEVRLFKRLAGRTDHAASSGREYAGPPAAT